MLEQQRLCSNGTHATWAEEFTRVTSRWTARMKRSRMGRQDCTARCGFPHTTNSPPHRWSRAVSRTLEDAMPDREIGKNAVRTVEAGQRNGENLSTQHLLNSPLNRKALPSLVSICEHASKSNSDASAMDFGALCVVVVLAAPWVIQASKMLLSQRSALMPTPRRSRHSKGRHGVCFLCSNSSAELRQVGRYMTPQSHFMIVAPIVPERVDALRALLTSMNEQPGVARPDNPVIPFAPSPSFISRAS